MSALPYISTVCGRCGGYLSPGTSHAGTCTPSGSGVHATYPPDQSVMTSLRIAAALERIADALERSQ